MYLTEYVKWLEREFVMHLGAVFLGFSWVYRFYQEHGIECF